MTAAGENPTPGAAALEGWCRQAVAGDADALQALLNAHHRRLLSFIRRKVGVQWQGKLDPEDVLQEAYIQIFDAIRAFVWQGEESFYHWATQIIDHRFFYHVRRLRTQKRDIARETAPAAPNQTLSGFDGLLTRCLTDSRTPSRIQRGEEAIGALMGCIAQLPEDYRTVIQRLYIREEPLAQIAADMGRSEDAVRRLGHRALERLQECLGRASRYLSRTD